MRLHCFLNISLHFDTIKIPKIRTFQRLATSGRSQNLEGGGKQFQSPSSFITNEHNELYVFYTEKGGFKKNQPIGGGRPHRHPLWICHCWPLIQGFEIDSNWWIREWWELHQHWAKVSVINNMLAEFCESDTFPHWWFYSHHPLKKNHILDTNHMDKPHSMQRNILKAVQTHRQCRRRSLQLPNCRL